MKKGLQKRQMMKYLMVGLLLGLLLFSVSCRQEAPPVDPANKTESPAPMEENRAEEATGDPETPTTGDPETPTTGDPETPTTGDPETPVTDDPVTPASVDLVMFMGQSNMAGRGSYSDSVSVPDGHAYEFKAVSDPTKLYPLSADFGVAENRTDGAFDGNKKTGSLLSIHSGEIGGGSTEA